MRGHSMVRRLDPNGEVFVCWSNCSGYATNRLGPKLMNLCQSHKKHRGAWENVETKSSSFEEGQVPDTKACGGKSLGESEGHVGEANTWNCEDGCLLSQISCGDNGQTEDVRGALPKDQRDLAREEHEAVHEENIFDSWLRRMRTRWPRKMRTGWSEWVCVWLWL